VQFVADLMYEVLKWKKIAVLYNPGDAWSAGSYDEFRKRFVSKQPTASQVTMTHEGTT
jgi:hypothetical protein